MMHSVALDYVDSAAAFVMATAALRTAYRHDRKLVNEFSKLKRLSWHEMIDALHQAADQLT